MLNRRWALVTLGGAFVLSCASLLSNAGVTKKVTICYNTHPYDEIPENICLAYELKLFGNTWIVMRTNYADVQPIRVFKLGKPKIITAGNYQCSCS
jgi:hypothetical protein